MTNEKKNDKKKIVVNQQPVGKIKINPNPAANANIDKDKITESPDTGVGSEITDGEGG